MSWWEANQGRRQNISRSVENINQTLADMARLKEQRASRIQDAFGNMASGLGDIIQARKGRQFEKEREADRAALQRELTGVEIQGRKDISAAEQEAMARREEEQRKWEETVGIPGDIRKAAAGRAEQQVNTYGGDPEMGKILRTEWEAWEEQASIQHPDWFEKDPDTGDILKYKIPPEGYKQFGKRIRALYPGISEDIINTYTESIGFGSSTPEKIVPLDQQLKPWGPSKTPAYKMLSEEQRNLLQSLQSAANSSKNLQDSIKAKNFIYDIQQNPQNYQPGSKGWMDIVNQVDKMIQNLVPGPKTMPKYGTFGLE